MFNEDNTYWEEEDGHKYLVYKGSMEELSEETGISEDKLYEVLGEYEDEGRDLVEHQREIEEAKRGEY